MKAFEEIELDSESIAYRGEGNATLVIALKDVSKLTVQINSHVSYL